MSTTVPRFALHPIEDAVDGFAPVLARTSTVHAPIDPVAYDCVNRRASPAHRRRAPSDRLQVLHWRVDEPFADDVTHLHRDSDEAYVVLEGTVELEVEGVRVVVPAGEAVTVGAGVPHALVAVRHPARGLTIRGPAGDDKVVTGFR